MKASFIYYAYDRGHPLHGLTDLDINRMPTAARAKLKQLAGLFDQTDDKRYKALYRLKAKKLIIKYQLKNLLSWKN